jgi:hypothetical protein
MKSVTHTLASVVVAFAASVASAQPFIEFHVESMVSSPGSFTSIESEDFKAVFDISVQPELIAGGIYRMDAVYSELEDRLGNISDSPVIVGDPMPIPSLSGSIRYQPLTDTLTLFIDTNIVEINAPLGDFTNIATSFPDDPEAYRVDTANSTASMTLFSSSSYMAWNSIEGFDVFSDPGAFTVRVRFVEDPNAPEPCIADLNDDGNLNFLDISKYLELYGDGCP